MQTKSNFNAHIRITELRETDPKFAKLDNRVRALAFLVGRGTAKKTEEAEYKKLEKQRNDILAQYAADRAPKIEFGDKTDRTLSGKLETYCQKFPNARFRNIVFMGATGTGKTYCAKIMASKLRQTGFRIHFDSAYNLIKTVRIDEIPAADLLIIDDLGTEPDHKNNNEYLYNIIAERYENDLPFIITTNLSADQLRTIYDERIYSRIFDKHKTAVIKFDGEDMRLN